LARPSIDRAHDALHPIERGAVQGLLEVGLPRLGVAASGKFRDRRSASSLGSPDSLTSIASLIQRRCCVQTKRTASTLW
jgi:hypothetical protein